MTVLTTNHAIDSDTVRSPLRAPCGARHRGRYDVTGQQSADVMTKGTQHQTLIASVLHKYMSGRPQERRSRLIRGSTATARKRAAR